MKKILLLSSIITISLTTITVFGQEDSKRKLQDDFEQYKKSQEQDFQDFKKKREAELKRMEQEYQDYYNEMMGLKTYYIIKKDTAKVKVVSDIISYEKNISEVLGKTLKVTQEVKFETKQNEPVKVEQFQYKIQPRTENKQEVKQETKDEVKQENNPTITQPEVVEQPNKVKESSTSNITPSLVPLPKEKSIITSPFGVRNHPILGRPVKHNGVDFGSGRGTTVYAASDGKVVLAEFNSSFGNYIVIEHKNGQSTAYAHLDRLNISKGDEVTKGQLIGYTGSTGRSTGPHLHFEVRTNGTPVDPKNYLIEYK